MAPDLTPVQGATPTLQVGGCGPDYTNQVSVAYSIDYASLPASRYHDLLTASKRWFESRHYKLQDTRTSGALPVSVSAETPDGFEISYNVAVGGTSWFATASPCVSES